MGSITNSLTGLSYLTQPGGPLASVASQLPVSVLKSASPQDVVSLSMAALQTQEVDGLFGISPAPQNALQALPTLPALPIASASSADALPGVASADLANATPQQKAAINNQALLLQQAQGLFGEPASTTGTTNVFG